MYTHTVLMAAVVRPGGGQVLALEPEYLSPQDGHEKQDCESAAAKRWIARVGSPLSRLGLTLLGDDLYANVPTIQQAEAHELDYIFVAKESSHKHLYQEIRSLAKLGELKSFTGTQGRGKAFRRMRYRFLNGVSLSGEASTVQVNWVERVSFDAQGKRTSRKAFVTNHEITQANAGALVAAGGCRWKIENEDFNTLKTKGYHFEHNFGHGRQYLSQTLLSLNILAFLFHTVLELLDERCATVRQMLPRRDTFFQHLSALAQYLPFADMSSLLEFMLRGLRDGPGPHPQSLPIRL